jgi:hypothetical protein
MREARVRAGAGALAAADLGVDQVNAVSAKPGGYEAGLESPADRRVGSAPR